MSNVGVQKGEPRVATEGSWLHRMPAIGGACIAFVAGAAVMLALTGELLAEPWLQAVLGGLAAVGVLALAAGIAGLIRVGSGGDADDLHEHLFESLPEACAVTDSLGRVIAANAGYRVLADAAEGERVSGIEVLYAGYPDVADHIYRLAEAARKGVPAHEDLRLVEGSSAPGAHPDRAAWLRIAVRPVETPRRGKLTLWTVADMTADRASQERAFQQLQHIIDYLDHAPAGFFSADAQGHIQYLNATLAGWLGLDLAETTGGVLQLSDIMGPEGARLIGSVQAPAGGSTDEVFDIDFVSKAGHIVPARVIHRVTLDGRGNKAASRSLVLNRSPGTDVAENLRAAEVRFARFFNNAPIGIATLAPNGQVREANGAFAEVIGQAAVRGKSVLDFVSDASSEAVAQALESARQGRIGIPPVDVTFSGEPIRTGQFYISRIEEHGEDGPTLIVYAIDTTEHKALEVQFTQSQKMQAIGQLAGGVAHDFNNVLTAIIGFSDLLLARHRPTDPSFQDIMSIKQNANRAANLVRQLLAFSRRQTLRPEVLSLTDVIADLGNLLGRLLGEKIELNIIHGRELWPVKVDVNQFEQVIMNLAVNARDAMPDGGSLTIRTANVPEEESRSIDPKLMPAGDYVLCEVSDTGTGMTKDVMEKIYEPFFSTKEVGKGTGLGLSTVYGIVKQTGGYIFCDSELGKGTVFRIYLPRYEVTESGAEAQPRRSRDEAEKPEDLTGKGTVLLVEDEEAVRAFAVRALTSRGYTVLEADSGEVALELIDQHPGEIDLVVSDVVMPEIDGPTLLKELRKRGVDTKIIFISGYAEDAFRKNLENDEKFAFLPKPFSLKQLVAAVKDVLGN